MLHGQNLISSTFFLIEQENPGVLMKLDFWHRKIHMNSFVSILQYYLEKNLDARDRELEREAELEEKTPKTKAKSKMSKVTFFLIHFCSLVAHKNVSMAKF